MKKDVLISPRTQARARARIHTRARAHTPKTHTPQKTHTYTRLRTGIEKAERTTESEGERERST